MKEFIINTPQLQSLQKRLGSLLVWVICWLMWGYFLLPLLALSGWLLGDNSLSNEVRWFGGYKSLLELLEIYFNTLLMLLSGWLFWVVLHARRNLKLIPAALKVVDDADLCAFYQVEMADLLVCRQANTITVYFDEHGQIQKFTAGVGE